MKFPQFLRFWKSKTPGSNERAFDAAAANRLTADWIAAPLSADAALSSGLVAMRNRTRDLERNNEWARGFFRVLENNVLGELGIALQLRIKEANGRFDETANSMIEALWKKWGKVGNCTLDRRSTWRDVKRLVLRTMARDGEVLVRRVVRPQGLRLQVLEPDHLDIDFNGTSAAGNEIRFGVELDADRAVVAYHLLTRHPGEMNYAARPGTQPRIRIPANELFHLFIPDRADQTRGYPWMVASMKGLRMLDGYAEAELVAARTAAAKMGFFTRSIADDESPDTSKEGTLSMDASPGSFEELPAGYDFKEWNPNHPNSAYKDFVKGRLRGVASSLGISYTTLASDLEAVNYSSIRAGLLEERELWKALQRWMIEHFCEPVFSQWLEVEILRGALNLPMAKLWKFDQPEFQGRRWPWVDPLKDIEAAEKAIALNVTTRRKVIAEGGGDIYDVFQSEKADQELAKEVGIVLNPLQPPKQGPAPQPPEEN